jgi:hypothetical protein
MEKAAEMKPEDVLWRIDNPEISERQVREVLNWLVKQKKVALYLGKYSIDRIEFLEQKELYEASISSDNTIKPKGNNIPKRKPTKRKTFYVNPPKRTFYKYQVYILVITILTLGYLSYTFLDLEYSFEPSKTLNTHSETSTAVISERNKLYVSDDELYTESAKKAISYSFYRQNSINKLNVKELNRLQFAIDSIRKLNKTEMRTLQTELQTSISHSNTLIKKLLYCNIIVMALFLFMYFKKR